MALGNNIKTLVDGMQVTYAAIAEHCGTDTQAIQQLAARDSKKSQFAQSIAEYFGIDVGMLMFGTENDIQRYIKSVSTDSIHPVYRTQDNEETSYAHKAQESSLSYLINNDKSSKVIPVLRVITCGLREYVDMSSKHNTSNLGGILWPTKDPHAYAVKVFGSDLLPRCRHGEYVIIEPSIEVSPGDDVYVISKSSDQPLLCIYHYKSDGMYFFEDLNGKGSKTSIPSDEIESVNFVAGFVKPSLHVDLP